MTKTEQSLRAIAWIETWGDTPEVEKQYHYSRLKRIKGWTPAEVREIIKERKQRKAS